MHDVRVEARQRAFDVKTVVLRSFVDSWILLSLGMWLYVLYTGTPRAYMAPIAPLAGLASRALLWAGRDRLARWAILLPLCGAFGVLPIVMNGARTPSLAIAPLLVTLAGWLFGRRAMVILAAIFCILVAGMATAESQGWWTLAHPLRGPDQFAATWIAALILAVVTTRAMLTSVRQVREIELKLQTQLLASERRLRLLLSGLNDAILLVGDDGRIQYANQAFCEAYSITEAPETLMGLGAEEFVRRNLSVFNDPEKALTRMREMIDRREPCLGVEATLRNGRTFLLDLIPLEYGAARYGRLWHLRDVTVLRAAQEKLLQVNQQLEALSSTDSLTGLANRRRFDAMLAHEWSRCKRFGHTLALILVDVDWFKRYNDHYGHLAGDTCLRTVGAELAGHARRGSDFVARYGGEEFVLIVPESDLQQTRRLSELVRRAVRERGIEHPKSPSGVVTVSVGVALAAPAGDAGPESLLRAADEALYRAKRRGRDCVEVSEALEPAACEAGVPEKACGRA